MSDLSPSPELALLLEAALSGNSKPLSDLNQRKINWEKLIRLANWHQVRPLLLEFLQLQDEQPEIPPKHLLALKQFAMGQAVTNMAFLGISVNLYQQLIAENVKGFLMKGALWAWLLYEKPVLREFGDIDFFIDKDDIGKGLTTLQRNGFAPDAYRKYLFNQEDLRTAYLDTDYQLPLEPTREHTLQSLEIQWRPSYPRYCYELSWEALSQNMISVHMAGSLIQIPNMENQLLMMVIHHGGVEQWDKLKYMADFVRLLRKFSGTLDWAYIENTSRKKSFNNLLNESMGMAHLLTGEVFTGTELGYAARYPSANFRQAILQHWENERPALKSKSWRIFAFNMRHRDNWAVKFSIVLGHLRYLTNLRLLWHKALWYKNHRS